MKLSLVGMLGTEIRKRLSSRRGQNTVEYLLMMTVIVGVVLVAGAALKKFMPTLFQTIETAITGAAQTTSQGN